MTIPTTGQLAVHRSSMRDRVAFAVASLSLIAMVFSLLAIFSIGVYIAMCTAPFCVLAVWLSPSPDRKALAILGVCWGVFCAILLAVAWSL